MLRTLTARHLRLSPMLAPATRVAYCCSIGRGGAFSFGGSSITPGQCQAVTVCLETNELTPIVQ